MVGREVLAFPVRPAGVASPVFSLLSAKWASLHFAPSTEDPSKRITKAGVNGGGGGEEGPGEREETSAKGLKLS